MWISSLEGGLPPHGVDLKPFAAVVFPARIEEFWAKTQSDSNSSILRLLPSSTMLRDHELPFLQFILLVVKKLLSSTLLHCKMKNPGVDGLLR